MASSDAEPTPALREIPTFHVFASEWFERQKVEGGRGGKGLAPKGCEDLQWRLSNHLLPVFASRRLNQITVEEVDHISALLDAAGKIDAQARVCRGQRRALLATLTFAGLRIGEALSLCWRDVDLARGTITVRAAKTDAGVRTVNLLPVLRDELDAFRARLDALPDAFVFGTSIGSQQTTTNVRRRTFAKAVEKANRQLVKDEVESLPEGLTPHSLRRTFRRFCSQSARHHPTSWRRWATPHRTSRWRSTRAAWTDETASLSV